MLVFLFPFIILSTPWVLYFIVIHCFNFKIYQHYSQIEVKLTIQVVVVVVLLFFDRTLSILGFLCGPRPSPSFWYLSVDGYWPFIFLLSLSYLWAPLLSEISGMKLYICIHFPIIWICWVFRVWIYSASSQAVHISLAYLGLFPVLLCCVPQR